MNEHRCAGLRVLNSAIYGKSVLDKNITCSVTIFGKTMTTTRCKHGAVSVIEQDFEYCPFCGKDLED